jgi:hypothetical protein
MVERASAAFRWDISRRDSLGRPAPDIGLRVVLIPCPGVHR